jgi:hypothetical protein
VNNVELETLWKRVIDHWDDPESHGAFLEFCQREQLLADAAARYRGMANDRERGPDAEKKLKGVAILALQSLEANRAHDLPPTLPRWFSTGSIMLFVTIALYMAFRAFH